MSGYQVVEVADEYMILAAPSVNVGYAEVACPAGKSVVSGGYIFDADPLYPLGEIVVDASYPSGNGWKVQFRNYGKGAAHFTTKIYAVCVYVDP